ncbi:MAG: G5 domain-containing protein [Anaerolineae bacterium]|nr:G5 domain-containing protein [Anaerolineae bacterium]
MSDIERHIFYARLWGILIPTILIGLLFTGCQPPPEPPRRVTLVVDDKTQAVETEQDTVRDVLIENQVTLMGLDRVTPPETTKIRDGLTISVTRVLQRFETFTETVPFERRVVRDASIPEGEVRLLQAGREGIREYVYQITLENNIEVERALIREAFAQPPEDEVQLVGTRIRIQTTPITGTLAYLNKQDAWLIRKSNATRRRLTTFGNLDGRVFTLSGDKTQLLFTRTSTETEHINELWWINTTEAGAVPISLGVYDILWADWKPNSNDELAWTTAEISEQPPGWRGQNDLYLGRISSRRTLVASREVIKPEAGGGYGWWGTRYTWSPDGEGLAYSRPEEVGTVNLRTGTLQPLLNFPAYRTYSSWAWNPHIAWSIDNTFITTLSHGTAPNNTALEDSPVFDLWTLEATGMYSAELASEVGMWATPQYNSQTGELVFGLAKIPYQSDISEYTLCIMDRDGTNRQCIYPDTEERGIALPEWHWSPDGTDIMCIIQGDLYLYSREDKTAVRLTDEGGITRLDWE